MFSFVLDKLCVKDTQLPSRCLLSNPWPGACRIALLQCRPPQALLAQGYTYLLCTFEHCQKLSPAGGNKCAKRRSTPTQRFKNSNFCWCNQCHYPKAIPPKQQKNTVKTPECSYGTKYMTCCIQLHQAAVAEPTHYPLQKCCINERRLFADA